LLCDANRPNASPTQRQLSGEAAARADAVPFSSATT
jgi:hypothetical protein